MRLYNAISKTPVLNDNQPEEKQHKRKQSSEESEFTITELVSKPNTPRCELTESTLRANDLFIELLNNQLRSKL